MERLKLWTTENPEAPVKDLVNELRSIQTFAALPAKDKFVIYFGAALSENFVKGKELLQHLDILKVLTSSQTHQRHLIAAIEWVCGAKFPSLLKYFPVALKQLFDEDLLDEAILLEWAQDEVRNEYTSDESMIEMEALESLKEAARPFIVWLEEAESEEESEEES